MSCYCDQNYSLINIKLYFILAYIVGHNLEIPCTHLPQMNFSWVCWMLQWMLSLKLKKKMHIIYGNIFETFIVSELYKRIAHTGTIPPLYFWRDRTGNEVDLLVEFGQNILPIEIKAARTYNPEFAGAVNRFLALSNAKKGLVLYAGEMAFGIDANVPTIPWWML